MADPKHKFIEGGYTVLTHKSKEFKSLKQNTLTMDESKFNPDDPDAPFKRLNKRTRTLLELTTPLESGDTFAVGVPSITEINLKFSELKTEASSHKDAVKDHLTNPLIGKAPLNEFLDKRMAEIKEEVANLKPTIDSDGYKKYMAEERARLKQEIEDKVNADANIDGADKAFVIKQLQANADRDLYKIHDDRLITEDWLINDAYSYAQKAEGQNRKFNNGIVTRASDAISSTFFGGMTHEEKLAQQGHTEHYSVGYTSDGDQYHVTFNDPPPNDPPPGLKEPDEKRDFKGVSFKGSADEQANCATKVTWTLSMQHREINDKGEIKNINLKMGNLKGGVDAAIRLFALTGGNPGLESKNYDKNGKIVGEYNKPLDSLLNLMQGKPGDSSALTDEVCKPVRKALQAKMDKIPDEINGMWNTSGWTSTSGAKISESDKVLAMAEALKQCYADIANKIIAQKEWDNNPPADKVTNPRPADLTPAEEKVRKELICLTKAEIIEGSKDNKLNLDKAANIKANVQSEITAAKTVNTNAPTNSIAAIDDTTTTTRNRSPSISHKKT